MTVALKVADGEVDSVVEPVAVSEPVLVIVPDDVVEGDSDGVLEGDGVGVAVNVTVREMVSLLVIVGPGVNDFEAVIETD